MPCPECGNEISDKAVMCPMCGYFPRGGTGSFYCFEYVSKRRLFGLPLGITPSAAEHLTFMQSARTQKTRR